MTFSALDTVVLREDLPGFGLEAGDVGAVVETYGGENLEVEFVGGSGTARALVTLEASQLRTIGDDEILAVRPVGPSRTAGTDPRIEEVRFDERSAMWVSLTDGRTIGVPLSWFPRLLRASIAELESYSISAHGLHWNDIDEDVSVAGLLGGQADRTNLRHPPPGKAPLIGTRGRDLARFAGTLPAEDAAEMLAAIEEDRRSFDREP